MGKSFINNNYSDFFDIVSDGAAHFRKTGILRLSGEASVKFHKIKSFKSGLLRRCHAGSIGSGACIAPWTCFNNVLDVGCGGLKKDVRGTLHGLRKLLF
jgi:hypothetical protein